MKTKRLILSDKVEKLLKSSIPARKEQSFERKLDTSLFDKVSEKGLLEKAEYSLPLTDTIGQRYFNDSKFSTE